MSSYTPYKGRSDSLNMNFLKVFLFWGQISTGLNPDPDPLTQLNPDPKHCQSIIISHLHFSLKTLPLCLV